MFFGVKINGKLSENPSMSAFCFYSTICYFRGASVVERSVIRVKLINVPKGCRITFAARTEYEIFCLIGSGYSIKDIADQLSISPSTVATYRSRIMEKTNLKSNVEITRYAILNKLVE